MTTTAQGTNEPLTYANAPTYVDEKGRRRMEREAMRELVRRNAEEDRELLDWLSSK